MEYYGLTHEDVKNAALEYLEERLENYFIDGTSVTGIEEGCKDIIEVTAHEPKPGLFTYDPIGTSGYVYSKEVWSTEFLYCGRKIRIYLWYWYKNEDRGLVSPSDIVAGDNYAMILTDLGEWCFAPAFAENAFDGEKHHTPLNEEVETSLWQEAMRSQRHRA